MDVKRLRQLASLTLSQASSDGRRTETPSSSKSGYMDVERLLKLERRRLYTQLGRVDIVCLVANPSRETTRKQQGQSAAARPLLAAT